MNGPGVAAPALTGVLTRAGLGRAGLSARRIEHLVESGTLRVLRAGVYVPAALAMPLAGSEPGAELLRIAAALATTTAASAGSHRSAATVHGLGLIGRQAARRVDVIRAPGARGSRSRGHGVLVHTAVLPADHLITVRGVPLTSAARTVVDLARAVPFAEGVALADSALHAEQASRGELAAVLACCARWPGIQRARRAVGLADPRSESVLESLGRAAFHLAGLPPPDLQVWVGDDGEIIGRADFLWPRYRTIAEADGAAKYAKPLEARAQLARDARLRAAGYEVVHFTWPEITRVPGQVVAEITAAFRRGQAVRG
jgi:Protein of unknown function (DUF559)